jgi:hypothetical protein
MALFLDIIVLGQCRDEISAARDLADSIENYFGPAVVELHFSVNLDIAARESANVPHVFQVVREDDDCERASHLVFAEVEKVDALVPHRNAAHLAGHAFSFSNMLAGLLNGKAVCHGEGWNGRGDHQDYGNCVCPHTLILWLRKRIPRDLKK